MSILTTFGNATIMPTNNIETVFTIMLMVGAHIMFAIFIGRIINCLFWNTLIQEKYKKKIEIFRIHLNSNNTSKFTRKNVMLYIKRLWYASNGEQVPSAMKLLNNATRNELLFNVYGYLLKKSIIFADVEDIFLKHLCQHLTRALYFSGDFIVQKGDFDKTMYFIHRGKVRN